MPLIEKLGLERQADYFGHAAPFHCFSGSYDAKEEGSSYKVAVVTNGKDRTYGCDNVRTCVVPCACTCADPGTLLCAINQWFRFSQVGTVPAALATYLAVEVSACYVCIPATHPSHARSAVRVCMH